MKVEKQKNETRNSSLMKISPYELKKISKEFEIASQDTAAIISRLQKIVKDLELSWDDAGQQAFYRYYQEWNSHISGVSQLLSLTADELNAIADRYSLADSDSPGDVTK